MFLPSRKTLITTVSVGAALSFAACSSAQLWRSESWFGYGGNNQHTAMSTQLSASPMTSVVWTTPVDVDPQYNGTSLYAHYAAPMVNYFGQVLVTVKTSAYANTPGGGNFRVEGHNGLTGKLYFTQTTDYVVPSSDWVPTCGSALYGLYGMVTPGIGGTIYIRSRTDTATSTVTQYAFYGMSNYTANKSAYNNSVYICTPLTVDYAGNIYFGFRVTGSNPSNLSGGIAKVTPSGTGTYISASAAANDSSIIQPGLNCAPALSNDQSTLYISVSTGGQTGYLVGIDTATMTAKYSAPLVDPRTGGSATILDLSTATPMVGPDNDVYYGVFESGFYNDRGWMLHFNGTLTETKIPGSFGWDDTASVVPASCIPSYAGTSSYLILTKYNNYYSLGPGGNGINKVAILDPNNSFGDALNGPSTTTGLPVQAMVPVLSVIGPTPDPNAVADGFPNAVHEWCINSAAIDVRGKAAILNSEDGHCYRWDLTKNALTQTLTLSQGLGEAYTSTIIGKYGLSFAINNAVLCAVGRL